MRKVHTNLEQDFGSIVRRTNLFDLFPGSNHRAKQSLDNTSLLYLQNLNLITPSIIVNIYNDLMVTL
jgi:hypothetical protein